MSAPSSHLKVFATSVLVVALVALVATVVAIRDRGVFDAQCELMSIAQEDAARRIRTLKRNQRIVREHSEKTAISAARSLARLVENDESLERHPERL